MVTSDEAELIEITILKLKAIRLRLRRRAHFCARQSSDSQLHEDIEIINRRIRVICEGPSSVAPSILPHRKNSPPPSFARGSRHLIWDSQR
jgi:hypothetical protein